MNQLKVALKRHVTGVYREMKMDHGCSCDDVVCNPRLRALFMGEIRSLVETTEFEALKCLLGLRKAGSLSPKVDVPAVAE